MASILGGRGVEFPPLGVQLVSKLAPESAPELHKRPKSPKELSKSAQEPPRMATKRYQDTAESPPNPTEHPRFPRHPKMTLKCFPGPKNDSVKKASNDTKIILRTV